MFARSLQRIRVCSSVCIITLGVTSIFSTHASLARAPGNEPAPVFAARFRQPTALALTDDGTLLLVANLRTGTVSLVDTRQSRVVAESVIGQSCSDIVPLKNGRTFLAVDPRANELLLLTREGQSIQVVSRLRVSADPIRVAVLDGDHTCVVSSRWSRRVTFVTLEPAENPTALTESRRVDLPFGPRELLPIADGKLLLVADAFGGGLSVVDAVSGEILFVRSLPGHNIRGLARSPDGQSILITHQVLHRLGHTTFDDIHWGSLISNHVRTLRLDALVRPGSDVDILADSHLLDLGEVGRAAGDPGSIVCSKDGEFSVALEGVDEILINPRVDRSKHRVTVGRRPTAFLASPDGRLLYVANSLDDTIAVIARETRELLKTIPLGPRPEPTAIDRGERLFSDARVSLEGWMSCQSCHTDGHSNGLLSDTLGDGSFGAPKRIPSLFGVGSTGPWAWTGTIERLEDQLQKSIETTMRGRVTSPSQIDDLSAYIRSLTAPSSMRQEPADPAVVRGNDLFRTRKCATCHTPPAFTSPERYDVGLVDEVGNRKFNPPSLRGVAQRGSLLHDGRGRDIEDVLLRHRHPNESIFSPQEAADLAHYLKAL